jgi:type IV pilus assembly protein PilC
LAPEEQVTYHYLAYTTDRKLVRGTIEADTEMTAEGILYQTGYKYIVSLEAARPKVTLSSLLPTLYGVKQQDVIDFSRQLATFVESGIAPYAALQLIEEQLTNRAFKTIVLSLAEKIQGGQSFSDAIGHHPEAFSYSYCQIMKASEHLGNLESGLRQIADYMEQELKMRNSIMRALSYPVLLTAMAIGVFVLLVTMVLPQILSLFSSLDASLPWTTRMIIGLSQFFTDYRWPLLVLAASLVAAITVYVRLPAGRLSLDKLVLKFPVIGTIVIQRNMSRFCRTASMMLKAGLQLQDVMNVASQTAGTNQVIVNALDEVREKLLEGQGLSRPMSENGLFPSTMVKMIAMGEQTGTIDSVMSTMAGFYEERVNLRLQALISMIEPTITIIMGLIVAFILVSILMPMYSVLTSLR